MASESFLTFRGAITGAVGHGAAISFTTQHPEGHATGVYTVDFSDLKQGPVQSVRALPAGGRALVSDGARLWVAGSEGGLFSASLDGVLERLPEGLDTPADAMCLVHDGLAVLCGKALLILDRATGARRQRLMLAERGTCLAADATGRWLAVGDNRGGLSIYSTEESSDWARSGHERVHEGPVRALLFQPDELRVLSAGGDLKLFSTHARGRLEPEDRGGKQGHAQPVAALLLGQDGTRFYSSAEDSTVKTWQVQGSRRSATLSKGPIKAHALAWVDYAGFPVLVQVAESELRLFRLNDEGRPEDAVAVVRGARSWVSHELKQKDPRRRQPVLEQLAAWNDSHAVATLASSATSDRDHQLRCLAASLLAASGNPRAAEPLEKLLSARDAEVRASALAGLRRLEGQSALRPLTLALSTHRKDIGVAAVDALQKLAVDDDQARAALVGALDGEPVEVRVHALRSLEAIHPADAPTASLIALRSGHAGIRSLALVRLFQRSLLKATGVETAIRRHGADDNADVRDMAFRVGLMTRPALARALRALDADLHRKLHELETWGQEKPGAPKAVRAQRTTLDDGELRPLLEALASRALDTCLRGARGLAALRDERAFGTLLQLSRESSASARVEVCTALRDLGDRRGVQRLRAMLRDGEAQVRDAAYTALLSLEQEQLDAAEAGLRASHEDVRRRGLSELVAALKRSSSDERALGLLAGALNDASEKVRGEAFKATLNLRIGGSEEQALRFALRSLHASVRVDALVELMGQVEEPWAWELLLGLFDDPEGMVRKDAFEFACEQRGRTLEALGRALRATHTDLRRSATSALAARKDGEGLPLLVQALDDEDREVRQAALGALLKSGSEVELRQAMTSRHADIRVRAAAARAEAGDMAALEPLLALVSEERPEVRDLRTSWKNRVVMALGGLAELGEKRAVSALLPLLESEEGKVREAAARALAWCADPADTSPLHSALQNQDPAVKQQAGLGLAWCGDPVGISLLAGAAPASSLLAHLALGERALDGFLAFLDHNDSGVRQRALQLLVLIEMSEPDEVPDRLLAMLSSRFPEVRLVAARGLEHFGDRAGFTEFVQEFFNDRGEKEKPHTLSSALLARVGHALVAGAPRLKVRVGRVLGALSEGQSVFEARWARLRARHGELDSLEAPRREVGEAYGRRELARVVFGAYAGLSRQQGSSAVARIRRVALKRLTGMATRDEALGLAAWPILVQALSDGAAEVRKLAFQSLRALRMPEAELGPEALASGQRDVGAMGLALLASAGGGDGVLEDTMLGGVQGLDEEALEMLAERRGWVPVLSLALGAGSERLRKRAVDGLAERMKEDGALDGLRRATRSRYPDVRQRAALTLARLGDGAAFDVLVELLAERGRYQQQQAINAFRLLGDERAASALLDRIDNDPTGSALHSQLIQACGAWRVEATAPRLLALMENSRLARYVQRALLTISNFDQPIRSASDESPTPLSWEEEQRPRRPRVLAQLMEALYEQSNTWELRRLIPQARWARGSAAEPVLDQLAAHPDATLREHAIEALGFRLRARGGTADALVGALQHSDPTTRFFAAQALAKAQRDDGLTVLLSAVDLLPSQTHRNLAVTALGQLADKRALPVLLRLVAEPGPQQASAAQAIGHLGGTEQADEIFRHLQTLAAGSDGVAQSALIGLRWFDTADAWSLILGRAEDADSNVRRTVARQLAHRDDDRAREWLEHFVVDDANRGVAQAAVQALRAQRGPEDLETDLMELRSRHRAFDSAALGRVTGNATPEQLFDTLGRLQSGNLRTYQPALEVALLGRDPLPVETAAGVLGSGNAPERSRALAARLLGRAAGAASSFAGTIGTALNDALEAWADEDRPSPRQLLSDLIWAAGRLAIATDELVACAALEGSDARSIREAALLALASQAGTAAARDALGQALVGHDAGFRSLAASALAGSGAEASLVGAVLDDRASLDRLLARGGAEQSVTQALRGAGRTTHRQGVVLSHLVQRGDVEGLAALAQDGGLGELARLGAIEALGREASSGAQEQLRGLGADSGQDDEIRKAAWRALRRARRRAAKREVSA